MSQPLAHAITTLLENPADDRSRQELGRLLQEHPELAAEYVAQWRVHCLLQWSLTRAASCKDRPAGDAVEPTAVDWPAARPRASRRLRRTMAVAAAGLAAVAAGLAFWSHNRPLGSVVAVRNVVWSDGGKILEPGEAFRGGILESSDGACSLRFDSGVELLCDGAFRLRLVDGMLVELMEGKLRANVPAGARGFSVDTPDTFLVDQGTEFGVSARARHGTDVVVFQGEVDVRTKDAVDGDATRRLYQGEAAKLVSGRPDLNRVSQVVSGGPPLKWSAQRSSETILSIRDNIRTADSLKYYNVVLGGLDEDDLAWVDRPHQWNGIYADGLPPIIRGAEYVQTFNDDRYNPNFQMYVRVKKPATLYVFIDDRVAPRPQWLLRDFEDTGEDLGLDEGHYLDYVRKTATGAGQSVDQVFSIYRRVVARPEEVTLGYLGEQVPFGMYGIAATPLP